MNPCVCGHHRDSHTSERASVWLPPDPTPLYKIPHKGFANNIATGHPRATYTRDSCLLCGCSYYEADGGS